MKHNERSRLNIFGNSPPEIYCDRSPRAINLMARSAPCERLANSPVSTFFSRNSILSRESERDIAIFFSDFIYEQFVWNSINIIANYSYILRLIRIGGLHNEKFNSISDSAADLWKRALDRCKDGRRTRDLHACADELRIQRIEDGRCDVGKDTHPLRRVLLECEGSVQQLTGVYA